MCSIGEDDDIEVKLALPIPVRNGRHTIADDWAVLKYCISSLKCRLTVWSESGSKSGIRGNAACIGRTARICQYRNEIFEGGGSAGGRIAVLLSIIQQETQRHGAVTSDSFRVRPL